MNKGDSIRMKTKEKRISKNLLNGKYILCLKDKTEAVFIWLRSR